MTILLGGIIRSNLSWIPPLYGMNVDIPAIEDESLKFLGRYTTFILIVVGSSEGAVLWLYIFTKSSGFNGLQSYLSRRIVTISI